MSALYVRARQALPAASLETVRSSLTALGPALGPALAADRSEGLAAASSAWPAAGPPGPAALLRSASLALRPRPDLGL